MTCAESHSIPEEDKAARSEELRKTAMALTASIKRVADCYKPGDVRFETSIVWKQ